MSISKRYKIIKRGLGRALVGRNPFDLAYFFCRGRGLEVGARNNPYPFSGACKVEYADIGSEGQIENILDHGFRLGVKSSNSNFAKVDHVLMGPRYGFDHIHDNSFDFVYSDNVLEHTPNPIFSLIEQLRITKVGGYIYVVIPNKCFTFDRFRAPTPVKLLIEKYQNNIFHYSVDEALDIIFNTEDFPIEFMNGDSALDFAKKMILADDGSYHFHVFDIANVLEMLDYVCKEAPSNLSYFSAPDFKHIHFTLCKTS